MITNRLFLASRMASRNSERQMKWETNDINNNQRNTLFVLNEHKNKPLYLKSFNPYLLNDIKLYNMKLCI